MIKMYKNYKKGIKTIRLSNKVIFNKVKDLMPHYHILSDERKELEINCISAYLSAQIIEVYELTLGETIGLKPSRINSLISIMYETIFNILMEKRYDCAKRHIVKIREELTNKSLMKNASEMIAKAETKSSDIVEDYLDEKLEKHGYAKFRKPN